MQVPAKIRIQDYSFTSEGNKELAGKPMGEDWPVVYLIHGGENIYIGETTSASTRLAQHLLKHNDDWVHPSKPSQKMNVITIIFDKTYNKSAVLDIEQNLIRLCSADKRFTLENGNAGQSSKHNYFERERYLQDLPTIWAQLKEKDIAKHSYLEIVNSDLFKYSPYTSLTEEQYAVAGKVLEDITSHLENDKCGSFVIKGEAGTGKTILAMSLVKTLMEANKKKVDTVEQDEDALDSPYHKLLAYRKNHLEELRIAYVVPMTSLRKTLLSVFKANGIVGIVKGPSNVAKAEKPYDIVFVDESHRLAKYQNIGFKGSFKKTARALGLDENTCSQLDWILQKSKYTVLFYDEAQSIKKADITKAEFDASITKYRGEERKDISLTTQMRCQGGNEYISDIDDIMHCTTKGKPIHFPMTGGKNRYEVKLYDSCKEMIARIKELEKKDQLCRVVAGYSWKWLSKDYKTKEEAIKNGIPGDITIEGEHYFWNMHYDRWILSPTAIDEIGCIHTTQGFDLNYCAVIFGEEIDYDKEKNRIIIDKKKFSDKNVKKGLKEDTNNRELTKYILNAYLVMLKRGIKGTFIYACKPNMREYLHQFFDTQSSSTTYTEQPEIAAEP